MPDQGCTVVEAYTLRFADDLASCSATWQLAAEYFAWCPEKGAERFEKLILESPIVRDDETAARKALALCGQHKLASLQTSLCK